MNAATSGDIPLASGQAAVAEAPQTMRGAGWVVSRLLVTLGAFVFAYSAWISWEWAVVTMQVSGKTLTLTRTPLSLSEILITKLVNPLGPRLPEFLLNKAGFIVSLLLVVGPLLVPLVGRRSDSLLGAIAAHLLGVWVLLATAMTIWMRFLDKATLQGLGVDVAESFPTSLRYEVLPGFWLAVAALAALWVGLILLLASEWRTHVFWHGFPDRDERTRTAMPGVGLLTLGVLLWAYGYLVTAWVTFGCTQTPLFFGTCQGYNGTGVLDAAIVSWEFSREYALLTSGAPSLLFVSPGVAQYAVPLLLGVGAAMVIIGGWIRPLARAFTAWATAWLLGATGFAALTYFGLTQLTVPGAKLLGGLPGASGASSSPATFLGLLLALIALVALWVVALRPRTGRPVAAGVDRTLRCAGGPSEGRVKGAERWRMVWLSLARG